MIDVISKQILDPASFSNDGTMNADAVKVRVNAGSVVKAAIDAAVAGATIPDATDTVKGKVSLAVASNNPSTSDTEATTPAYVSAAIAAAVAALPADKFISSMASYNPATNIATFNLNGGGTVNVDFTQLVADAVASVTTGKIPVNNNAGTLIGYLLPV